MSWASLVTKEVDIENIPDNITECTEPDVEMNYIIPKKRWSNPRFRTNILDTEIKPTPRFEEWRDHYLLELDDLFMLLDTELKLKEFKINTCNKMIFDRFCRIIYNKSSKYM